MSKNIDKICEGVLDDISVNRGVTDVEAENRGHVTRYDVSNMLEKLKRIHGQRFIDYRNAWDQTCKCEEAEVKQMELCLGTVQFGMDYGIRGKRKPSLSDALDMIDYAIHHGVRTIDTANAYGEAEDVVGTYLKKNQGMRQRIHIISKFRPNLLDDVLAEQYYQVMKANLEESLQKLHTDYLDGYLLHSARYVYNDTIIDALLKLKKEGYVKKIGVSVYEIDEAKKGISRDNLDFLQLPFSVLDQRMLHDGVFELAETKGFPLHTRSAFVQGLVMMEPEEVPLFLREKAAPILQAVGEVCRKTGLTRTQLAVGFVKQQKAVTHLVFGVRNIEQLKEDIMMFSKDLSSDVVEVLKSGFANVEAEIVMPSLWKRS